MSNELVVVTGGSGFIASHCILQLLQKGYRVRTTLRSLTREAEVRAMLNQGGADPGDRLTFVAADLSADTGWAEAVAGCTYVLHGASPTPSGSYATEKDWIQPAVDGVLRVLRASRDAGVKRFVLTSAFGAIGMGHKPQTRPFDENDWTNLNGKVAPYQKSKTLSERAAWDFIAKEGRGLELSVVNPTAVLGPVLAADYSHSIRIVQQLMDGLPGCPKINSGFVDARDVADLHLRAMIDPAANGERFIAISGESLWMLDLARILKRRMGATAAKVPTRELPSWIIRTLAIRNPTMKNLVPFLGVKMNATSQKAIKLLCWSPRSSEEAIVAAAESLQQLGLLKR
ncbi:SDR family oxidoreductase [Silvibacterium acidisoli]|uniref:SDR family oxidoreductase n=1 Tax=Acidobacteriaceae bacterium ZG23-2 TaxID=2883246 RepID=UPI00406D3ACE